MEEELDGWREKSSIWRFANASPPFPSPRAANRGRAPLHAERGETIIGAQSAPPLSLLCLARQVEHDRKKIDRRAKTGIEWNDQSAKSLATRTPSYISDAHAACSVAAAGGSPPRASTSSCLSKTLHSSLILVCFRTCAASPCALYVSARTKDRFSIQQNSAQHLRTKVVSRLTE